MIETTGNATVNAASQGPVPDDRKENHNAWAWIWLCYTGFLFLQPILEPGRAIWLGSIAAFLVFLAIMWVLVRSTKSGQAIRFRIIAATFALGLLCFPWNQGGSTFFVYAAAFLPFSNSSIRRVLWLFLAESLLILGEGWIFTVGRPHGSFHVGWPNTLVAIFLVIIIGGGNIFFAQQKKSERKLRAALEENLALAAVAERERIARDLHDVLGHTLSVIVLKAELAGRLIGRNGMEDPKRAAAEIGDVERIARTALSEVREAIGGYRARGLAAEIEAARRTLEAAGVALVLDEESADACRSLVSDDRLSPAEETALALALREAVTNIVRHARATTCHLRFLREADRRRLVVEDNGHQAVLREGNGLRGMRERLEALGGHLSLECDAAKQRGTRILIELPIRNEEVRS